MPFCTLASAHFNAAVLQMDDISGVNKSVAGTDEIGDPWLF